MADMWVLTRVGGKFDVQNGWANYRNFCEQMRAKPRAKRIDARFLNYELRKTRGFLPELRTGDFIAEFGLLISR